MSALLLSSSVPDWLSAPWHWSVSGAAIALVLFLLTWMGQSFGVSSVYNHLCTVAGAGKKYAFFNTDLKGEIWRFIFIAGAILGGFLTVALFSNPDPVAISDATIAHLQQDWGISYPQGGGFLPDTIFNLTNPKGIVLAIIGGFLVGFGARYAGGCTSGHAITGLSHLQLPSLITVIGFFIGGLTMTWLIMPLIFG